MKRGLALTAALLSSVAMVGSAFAADLDGAREGSLKDAPVSYAAPFSWSGLYFGGHIGGTWSSVDFNTASLRTYSTGAVLLNPTGSMGPSSFIGGVQFGLQRQFGRFVAGVEVGYSFQDLSETKQLPTSFNGSPMPLSMEVDDLWTVAGRLGITNDKLLVYAKAGYASANVSASTSFGFDPKVTTDDREHGYLLGAGLEYAIRDNITVGVDYSYVNLDVGNRDMGRYEFVRDIDVDMHQVTFRVNLLLHHDRDDVPLK
ncbi:MAG: porin family protein [Hyphomicrobiaceae bacterium]|nr:porin family protein [Hyphomicrobiaceae bacterium]